MKTRSSDLFEVRRYCLLRKDPVIRLASYLEVSIGCTWPYFTKY